MPRGRPCHQGAGTWVQDLRPSEGPCPPPGPAQGPMRSHLPPSGLQPSRRTIGERTPRCTLPLALQFCEFLCAVVGFQVPCVPSALLFAHPRKEVRNHQYPRERLTGPQRCSAKKKKKKENRESRSRPVRKGRTEIKGFRCLQTNRTNKRQSEGWATSAWASGCQIYSSLATKKVGFCFFPEDGLCLYSLPGMGGEEGGRVAWQDASSWTNLIKSVSVDSNATKIKVLWFPSQLYRISPT